ncbi:ABC transporter permease [Mucilaginibacter terrae]|uniref:Lipoprotein-releasing system permease protein n=1 Tax=Mucilaginibacter terrae TaxID=1955052 RepID=A0ABU3H069_9SPHI|nr:FtsX-like permease family protein [Mucilaginibacter terrae]MDT3405413.1 lipoprotein-releasing system permease protein [Mucilaginibacter terrae]
MNFSSFIAQRLTFQSKRTFSKLIVRIAIVGIMLGLGVMILSIAIVKGFKREIQDKVRGFAGDIQITKFDNNFSYENSPFMVDTGFVRKVQASPLVKEIMPYATKPGIIKANGEIEGVVLKGVDKSYDWGIFKSTLVGGKVIDFADSAASQNQVMLSSRIANRLKLKVGDDLLMYFIQEPMRKRKLNIVGVYSVGVEDVDKTFVIGNLALIQRLNGWTHREAGGFEIQIKDFDNLTQASNEVNTVLPTYLRLYTINETYPAIFEWLSLLDVNTQVMLVLMIIVATINMISALLIMILERTAMIGMFKALGATNWSIQSVFLYNAAYLIGVGLLLGNTFGLGISWFQQKTHFFKLDQASYYMNFVPIELTVFDVVVLNVGTLVICLVVLLLPSMLVSRIQPVKAIRFK